MALDASKLRFCDTHYFNHLGASDDGMEVQSINTKHYWYLKYSGSPENMAIALFYKQKMSHTYKLVKACSDANTALAYIKEKDKEYIAKRESELLP